MLSPLASITLVRTVSFSVYQRAKYTYDAWMTRVSGHSPLAIANTRGARPNLNTMACFFTAGATAGAVITFIACTRTPRTNGNSCFESSSDNR